MKKEKELDLVTNDDSMGIYRYTIKIWSKEQYLKKYPETKKKYEKYFHGYAGTITSKLTKEQKLFNSPAQLLILIEKFMKEDEKVHFVDRMITSGEVDFTQMK